MALEEYKRKRDFRNTPEPGAKLGKNGGRRFVVQKHRASHLHFDFRLEMEGVLKSWAVPKGPSLDPADKRLAMQVEDHPVSYFDFEGIIPPGNYGAGTVQVWDLGTWEPLLPEGSPQRLSERELEKHASEMLAKGDFKFRLKGKKLKGDFVLARMRSRRPGSKGTEWLLIKKRDEHVKEGFDANSPSLDRSALSRRSLEQIAADEGSAEWESNRPASPGKRSWLSDAIVKADKKGARKQAVKAAAAAKAAVSKRVKKKTAAKSKEQQAAVAKYELAELKGSQEHAMPRVVHPMLATLVDEPFNDDDWLFEVKWDGYRALAFVDDGELRLVSRNQNELTVEFPELGELPSHLKAQHAILDGEICALDDQGRPSFSLMQQRDMLGRGKNNSAIVYYAFDLLYLEGFSLFRVDCQLRKELLRRVLAQDEVFRYSEHFLSRGEDLFRAARDKGLEGIVAKRRRGCYVQKRSREWLKVKITRQQECVIGGYTDPRGSREHFGSIVLGLYNEKGRLVPVGQAGSGFTQRSHAELWTRLQKLRTDVSPFHAKPESSRRIHYVHPELVAAIKFTEWTHEGGGGAGLKMRAPVFQGLRQDKKPEECRFEAERSARVERARAQSGEAA